jgi:hypothetical protein
MNRKVILLRQANTEFQELALQSRYKAKVFKGLDISIKIVLALAASLVTYFSENNNDYSSIIIRVCGVTIAVLTAVSSLIMFEKRSITSFQIYTKCKRLIPEIETKIDDISVNRETNEDIEMYIKNIFRDLGDLSLASFSDVTYEKMVSKRNLD